MEARLFNQLKVNGRLFTGEEIISFCEQQSEANVRALGKFMEEWLSPDLSVTLQTSGSTGTPKQIKVLKSQMLNSAAMTAQYFNFQAGQTVLLCLPMQYIAAKMMVVRALYSGLNLLMLEPQIDPLKNFHYEKEIDFIPLVPSQAHHIHPQLRIRKILLGGAPVHNQLNRKLQDKPYAVYQSYGMTETLSHVAIRQINGPSTFSYYKALEGVTLEVDERDCLKLSVPFLEEKIQTNDVVELRDQQSFYWKGRYDNIINSGGLKFFPEVLEEKIATVVKQPFFICAMSDKILGEKIVLCVESIEPQLRQKEDLNWRLSRVLTRHEFPKDILYIEKFIRTASHKLQRRKTLAKLKE